jgi:hypothetical protein
MSLTSVSLLTNAGLSTVPITFRTYKTYLPLPAMYVDGFMMTINFLQSNYKEDNKTSNSA